MAQPDVVTTKPVFKITQSISLTLCSHLWKFVHAEYQLLETLQYLVMASFANLLLSQMRYSTVLCLLYSESCARIKCAAWEIKPLFDGTYALSPPADLQQRANIFAYLRAGSDGGRKASNREFAVVHQHKPTNNARLRTWCK